MPTAFEAHKARFDRICEEAICRDIRIADSGIGTLGEKRLHAVIKRYLCEDTDCHEVGVSGRRFVSDIRIGNEIYEVQTGDFYPMRQKIAYYMEQTDCTVTVVHPLAAKRWMSWIDPKTTEISPRTRVTRSSTPVELLPQLYPLSEHLQNPRLRFCVLMLETQDFRLLNSRSRNPKLHTKHYERIPLALLDELEFNSPEDFRSLIPASLPARFTVKDFSKATKLQGRDAYSAVRVLVALGLAAPTAQIGRAMGFELISK